MLLPTQIMDLADQHFKAALDNFDARIATRDACIKQLRARIEEDSEAASAAAEQLAAKDALIAKLEARVARRDVSIAKLKHGEAFKELRECSAEACSAGR
jgi:uncharacterized protein (DUF3084 family)